MQEILNLIDVAKPQGSQVKLTYAQGQGNALVVIQGFSDRVNFKFTGATVDEVLMKIRAQLLLLIPEA